MGSDMGTPWGETIWDTLKENMHGDVDTFSWRPLLIIPWDISKRGLEE